MLKIKQKWDDCFLNFDLVCGHLFLAFSFTCPHGHIFPFVLSYY